MYIPGGDASHIRGGGARLPGDVSCKVQFVEVGGGVGPCAALT